MSLKQCNVTWCTATAEEHAGVCTVHRAYPVLNSSEKFEQWTKRIREARAAEERRRAATRGELVRAR